MEPIDRRHALPLRAMAAVLLAHQLALAWRAPLLAAPLAALWACGGERFSFKTDVTALAS